MVEWAAHARQALDSGQPCALISLLAVEGSAPRDAGTRMVVTPDTCLGSIGGGHLEYLAIQQARAALAQTPGAWRIQDYPLGPLLGQCCGGRVRLMVERLDPVNSDWLGDAESRTAFTLATQLFADHVQRHIVSEPPAELSAKGPLPTAGDTLLESVGDVLTPLSMFGAGHVGQAIARLLTGLPFDLHWYDNRPEFQTKICLKPAKRLPELAQNLTGICLILTHDHALDYQLTAAALQSPATFIGLIGSATKRTRFLTRLRRDGFDDTTLQRLVCPIGLPGVPGKAPEIIAVSVVAQLLQLREVQA